MNERIKELAIEAGYDMDMQQHQKFAELIVKECADVAYCHQNGFVVGSMIKAHFGVE
jgi:hypothetical protein